MTSPIDDPHATRGSRTAESPSTESPERIPESVDRDFPPGSSRRRTALARARAMTPGSENLSLYEILSDMPEILRQVLDSEQVSASQWLQSWSESIAKQARLDKKAALRAADRATQIAAEQRGRETLGADERAQLDATIQSLTALRQSLLGEEAHALNTHAPRPTLAEAGPADPTAGLRSPVGGVRVRQA